MSHSWHIRGVSITGASHRKKNRPNQDSFEILLNGRICGACLCDGAGSQKDSEKASRGITDAFIPVFENGLPPSVLGAVDLITHAGIQKESLHCTLSVFVEDENRSAVYQAGDSLLILQDRKGDWLVAPRHQGEFANSTMFLSEEDLPNQLLYKPAPAGYFSKFILSSDGLEHLLLADGEVASTFASLLCDMLMELEDDFEEELSSFLSSDDISTALDDDLTVVVGVRK